VYISSIKKPDGRKRLIYIPTKQEKQYLRQVIPAVTWLVYNLDCQKVIHGFMPNRSAVTNALRHVGYPFSVSFDLKDFFDTVTPAHFSPQLYRELGFTFKHFPDGAARQGLPSSPAICNLAAVQLDDSCLVTGCCYTRYADDLTFSCFTQADVTRLLDEVPQLIAQHNFILNKRKTRVQAASNGRRIITGVGVDDVGIYPTRRVRRRLRAALHSGHEASAHGLAEWCLLRPPGHRGRLLQKLLDMFLARKEEKRDR